MHRDTGDSLMLDQKAGESPMLYRDTENRLMLVQKAGDSLRLGPEYWGQPDVA